MPLLTTENLKTNYPYYYDYREIARGQRLYNDEQVEVTQFENQTAVCQVIDKGDVFQVRVTAVSKREISLQCNCGHSARVLLCAHAVAAVARLQQYVQREAHKNWSYRLALALEVTPPKPPKSVRKHYLLVFGLRFERYANGVIYYLLPYQFDAANWPGYETWQNLPTPQEQLAYLDERREWTGLVEFAGGALRPQSVVNLPSEGVQMFNLMNQVVSSRYGGAGLANFAEYLPVMASYQAPLFAVNRQEFAERLHILTEPQTLEAAMVKTGRKYVLDAGVTIDGVVYSGSKKNLRIISQNPTWTWAGSYLAPVENPEAVSMLAALPLTIPAEELDSFRDQFFRQVTERMPVQGEMITSIEVKEEMQPRLYLSQQDKSLVAEMRFGYGDYELTYDPRAAPLYIRDIPNSWSVLRIYRQLEREQQIHQMLTDARYGLKRVGSGAPPGTFALRARTHPYDFLLHSIPLLTQAGFVIYGEDNLDLGKVNRYVPRISLNITSGLDWFDLQATVHFGDQQVSLGQVRRAMRKGDNYIKLADGSVGRLPSEWLERYKHLFEMADETDQGLRLRDHHLPLVDTLLADADESQVAPEFAEHRQRLQGFQNITPQPIPEGLQGELRPYQKAGVDWLHFLNEYGFGGCLADDMGLGKTIQVLAFLLSLRQQGKLKRPALVVVPKSLLANWQRESQRFTPSLRLLEYFGQSRKKDTAQFDDYDIVLTTYGLILRDIEALARYRFSYAILDESQAIKNPLAQSAKAARLLNAERRLVMTGTPVENNTFELWSQFAFLNPGLLGSMDYFRQHFATPIESKQDQETAQLLRKLVYPFILRRTKDQVASELPPRSEKILYTDLEPAQRKLYQEKRQYYRDHLLGLIEQQGLDNTRMKVFEGLLRLRQICIHPALTDPTFQGESAKFEMLMETVETLHSEGHKALIFSQFVKTLHLLRNRLDAMQIPYAYLDGKTENRQEVVDRFQGDPAITFFLLSLKAGGVGLNLTAADYVIHIDPWWNPAVEMQAADRAHRIGQDKPVFVYKLIARDTIEEKILQLQDRKKALVSQLISAEEGFFKSLTADDVRELFS